MSDTTTSQAGGCCGGACHTDAQATATESGTSQSFAVERTLHHFAGRPDPVEFSGTARSRTFTVSASMWADWTSVKDNDGQSSYDELLAVADAPAPVCVCDPKGMRLFVSTDPLDESGLYEAASRVSLPLTVVGWSERVA